MLKRLIITAPAAVLCLVFPALSVRGAPSPPRLSRPSDDERFAMQRKQMVLEQILRREVRDREVVRAMEKVPRHLFVPEPGRAHSYEDGPLPIGYGQTISQPYIVALMTEALELKAGEKVLEVGTGSGYQAAVLAECGARVFSIEIVPELAQSARQNLKNSGYPEVRVRAGDGYEGWPEEAPFDAIIVTCSPEDVPPALSAQLREGGRAVIPIGPEGQVQELFVLKKQGGQWEKKSLAPVRFVPMTRPGSP